MANEIHFNEKLKFSWGHIISFIALVCIAYCTFVGMVYLLKGQFLISGIITAAVALLIGLLFMVPQQLKATSHRFYKRIKWERAFIFSSPVLFIALMFPFAHAWTVHHRQDLILESFNKILESSTKMFNSYEHYADLRKNEYRLTNEQLIARRSIDSLTFKNKQVLLDLILYSSNYSTLKSASNDWMNKSVNKDITTWNIFLLGNITEIQEAIHTWHSDLQSMSETRLSDEENPKIFDSSSRIIRDIDQDIEVLTSYYTSFRGFNAITLLWLLLGYAMLILPYLLQSRHTKTTGTNINLFGIKGGKSVLVEHVEQPRHIPAENTTDSADDTMVSGHAAPKQSSNNTEKYESFTI